MSYSPLKVNSLSGGTCRLYLQSRRISQGRNQREAGSKESSLHLQGSSETTRRYIAEDSTLHNHRCENLELLYRIVTIDFFWDQTARRHILGHNIHRLRGESLTFKEQYICS
jgi:hypothetical protein